MNKKYYIKIMSANSFKENKSIKKNDKENSIIHMMSNPEDDITNNINNQESKNLIFNNSTIMKIINELMHKISEIRYSNNQDGELFGNNGKNQGNNKTNSPNIQNEDLALNNRINQPEDNDKINKVENTLAKIMEEIEADENINVSSINNQENPNSIINYTIINIYNELKDKFPEQILSKEIIRIYIYYQYYQNFKSNNYIRCEKCGKNNLLFCENCSINLCDICSKNCKEKHQNKLIKLKDKIEFYKNEIEKIIQEYFNEPKKKDENTEKEQKSYQLIDKNKIIDEPIKRLEYSKDIILIKLIMDSNYNNYFHYKFNENCYKYMKREYDVNNQILMEYKIESNEKYVRIF